MHRADRRQAEEALAQMTARRQALEELERDRVGLAPAAAALLAARDRFDGGVLGPLSDFVSTGRDDAELAERLLGDWMHAVLVRDRGDRDARCRRGTPSSSPGALVLLPLDPGRVTGRDGPAARRPAAGRGTRGRLGAGRARRLARCSTTPAGSSGARAAPSSSPAPAPRRARSAAGPSWRRWARKSSGRTAALGRRGGRAAGHDRPAGRARAGAGRRRPPRRTRRARPSGRATAAREDAVRVVGNLAREMAESEAQLERVTERLTRAEQRLAEIDAALVEGDLPRSRLDEELGGGRSRLAELEAEQEAAREQRVHWQVQEAHVAGGLRVGGRAAAARRRPRAKRPSAPCRRSAAS